MKLRQGNVFTPVCDSVHGGGGLCHMTRGGLRPRGLCLGVSVQGGLCLGGLWSRGSLSRGVSVQVGGLSGWGVSVRVGGLCPGGGSLSRGVSVREVRILLECILVSKLKFSKS